MVTSLYASLLAFLFLYLSIQVIKGRIKESVALGSGSSKMLEQRIRAHANLSEYTPITLILLFAAESQNANIFLVHIIGLLFVMGRILHAYSLISVEKYDGEKITTSIRYRQIGMMLTFLSIFVLAVTNIIIYAMGALQ